MLLSSDDAAAYKVDVGDVIILDVDIPFTIRHALQPPTGLDAPVRAGKRSCLVSPTLRVVHVPPHAQLPRFSPSLCPPLKVTACVSGPCGCRTGRGRRRSVVE